MNDIKNKISNETVRAMLRVFLKSKGVKNRWIVLNTGLSDTSISRFLRNERDLDIEYLEKIYELMHS